MDSILNYAHPFVSTDAIVFSIKTIQQSYYRKLPQTSLKVLLYKREEKPFSGKYCIPGGFINIDEMPENNIHRKIVEKSQIGECFLEQLYTFAQPERDPRARVISIAYLGLLSEEKAQGENWFTISQEHDNLIFQSEDVILSEQDFGFDHYEIIKTALKRLRAKIWYSDIALNLLPSEFTLTQLQNVYEAITEKKELAANFRRKIAHLVSETQKHTSDKGHRPAMLYTKKI